MAFIKVLGSGLIRLTGNYGYDSSTVEGLPAYTTIDATGATWIVSNSANQYPDADTSYLEGSGIINRYPFIVYSAGYGLTLKGGTMWGEVPQTSDWRYTYNDSAALRLQMAPGVTVDSWRIDKAWDAIRIIDGSDNFLINDVHLSNIRDDAVENEYVLSGTIRDSLFDGVFAGVSLGNSNNVDGSNHTLTLQNTFIRMETYLVDGEMSHGSPIKANIDAPGTTPDIRIINSVIAIEDPTHNGFSRLQLAWDNVVETHGNIFLNLSDTPLPKNYPLPPAGFTILQGQAARNYWEQVKAAWLANHDGNGDVDVTPLPPLSTNDTNWTGDARNDFNGDGRSDILWRHDTGLLSDWLGQANGGFATNAANAWNGVPTSWQIAGTGDFNGDGKDDVLWRNSDGTLTDWLGQSNGGFSPNAANAWTTVAMKWEIAGTGDFNGDGKDDILWRHKNGSLTNWLGGANGGFSSNAANAWSGVATSWQIAGTGDFNGDGKDDILWRNNDGTLTDWLGQSNGGFTSNAANAWTMVPTDWQVAAIGDFNGDGKDDILWRHQDGTLTDWLGSANGGFKHNAANAWAEIDTSWQIAGTGDFNGDGRDDILWRSSDGVLTNWLGQANGGFAPNLANAWAGAPMDWHVQAPEINLI